MLDHIKPLLGKLCAFSQEKMGFSQPPKLFLRSDSDNSKKVLGKTAFYNPDEKSVTLFVTGRHPKDILRSFTHELVHHSQNLRGDLSPDKVGSMGKNYAQDNDHMRNMEKEAYLQGNMCFRDWEDTIEDKDKFLIKLAESKFLKENKTMTTKITKEFLRDTIRNILSEKIDGKKLANALMNNDKDYLKKADQQLAAKSEKAPKKQVAMKEADPGGELEIGPGLPDTLKPDLEIKPTLMQLVKKKQSDMMSTVEDAIAELKAELDAMEMQATEPSEPAVDEGSGGATREDDIEEAAAKPDFPDVDGDDNRNEPISKAQKDKKEKDGDDDKKEKSDEKSDKDMSKVPPQLRDHVKGKTDESKVQTPEQENNLYEQRFTPKNNRLFEKLVKEWTK